VYFVGEKCGVEIIFEMLENLTDSENLDFIPVLELF